MGPETQAEPEAENRLIGGETLLFLCIYIHNYCIIIHSRPNGFIHLRLHNCIKRAERVYTSATA